MANTYRDKSGKFAKKPSHDEPIELAYERLAMIKKHRGIIDAVVFDDIELGRDGLINVPQKKRKFKFKWRRKR